MDGCAIHGGAAVRTSDRYPTERIDLWRTKWGAPVVVRPILQRDAPLLGDLVRGLSGVARRQRFHGAVNGLATSDLERLASVDHRTQVAFVLSIFDAGGRERLIGDARYVCADDDPGSAEFAIMLDDRWHRLGLGLRALHALDRTAAACGLHWLYATTRCDNRAMLGLASRWGGVCVPDRFEDGAIRIEKAVAAVPASRAASRRSGLPSLVGRARGLWASRFRSEAGR